MARNALVVVALLLAACGSSSGPDTAVIQSFNTASQIVSGAVTAYGVQAAAMTSLASCGDAQGNYDAQARPMVAEMQGMGPMMDSMMGSMGHMDEGDMTCSANAMLAELNRHRAVACASTTDMAPNQAEARQHVASMSRWADHAMNRSRDLGSMAGMGMGGMMGSGTTTGRCVHGTDGTYTLQP